VTREAQRHLNSEVGMRKWEKGIGKAECGRWNGEVGKRNMAGGMWTVIGSRHSSCGAQGML
jgi:hypothetical protein